MLTVVDTVNGNLNATQGGIVVNPAAMSRIRLTPVTNPVTAGQAFSVRVTATDEFGNGTTGYVCQQACRVTFTAPDDPRATLPLPIEFLPGDQGEKVVPGFILRRRGTQRLVATDSQAGKGHKQHFSRRAQTSE